MSRRLLDRQASLFDYLRNDHAIFGDEPPPVLDPALTGIDHELLRIEARFSYEKRMSKIQAMLPRTFDLLGSELSGILREFNAAGPPSGISSYENARKFHEFMIARWRRHPPALPHLPDVAAYELACAGFRRDEHLQASASQDQARRGIRRHPDVVLLRCAYDIQPLFESCAGMPVKRDTPLAIAMAPGAEHTMVMELRPSIFEVLTLLDDFTDPAELSDEPTMAQFIAELSALGLLEVRT